MDTKIGLVKGIIPVHAHDEIYEVIVYTEGEGRLRTGGTEHAFSVGTMAVIPPGCSHVSLSEGNFARIFVNGSLPLLSSITHPTVIPDTAGGDGLMLAKLVYRNRLHSAEYRSSLLSALFGYILERIRIDTVQDAAVHAITNEIAEDFGDPHINLSEILRKSGYAEDYIRAHFKRVTGKTPVQYLTEVRIAHACLLIDLYRGTLSLSEIATDCGYTDYLYFSRRFHKMMGISPREYMKKGS